MDGELERLREAEEERAPHDLQRTPVAEVDEGDGDEAAPGDDLVAEHLHLAEAEIRPGEPCERASDGERLKADEVDLDADGVGRPRIGPEARSQGSPHLEAFRAKGYEVLFFTDPIDEWVVQGLHTYKEKHLKSIAKGDIDLDTEEEKKEKEESRKQAEEAHKGLVEKMKAVLGDKVKEVKLSQRLTESACCLVADEFGMGTHMEKIMRAMNQDVPPARRILELNPGHPVVDVLQRIFDQNADDPKVAEYTELLYDQALLTSALPVQDPLAFARRVSALMAAQGEAMLGK